MELVLVAVLVVLVLAGAGLVVTRRRRDTTLEPPPAAAERRRRPPRSPRPLDGADAGRGAAVAEPRAGQAPLPRPARARPASTLSGYVGAVLSREKVDQETWDDLEEALIRADVGVAATTDILDRLRATVDAERASPSPPICSRR